MSRPSSMILNVILDYLGEAEVPVGIIPENYHEVVRPQFVWLETRIDWCSRVEIHDITQQDGNWRPQVGILTGDILIQFLRNNYCLTRQVLDLSDPNCFADIANFIRLKHSQSERPIAWPK